MAEGAAVDAQRMIGRQEAGEIFDGLAPLAVEYQFVQMDRIHERIRLASECSKGLGEFVTQEEHQESPLPKARHAGVLRQTLALVAGDGEPEPTGRLPPAAAFPLRCHRAGGGGSKREGSREGGV